jgi:hypothetical protein
MENVNKFYEWMLKIGNIHLADNERMVKAFSKVINNN